MQACRALSPDRRAAVARETRRSRLYRFDVDRTGVRRGFYAESEVLPDADATTGPLNYAPRMSGAGWVPLCDGADGGCARCPAV